MGGGRALKSNRVQEGMEFRISETSVGNVDPHGQNR
jgi:hypothetical protein